MAVSHTVGSIWNSEARNVVQLVKIEGYCPKRYK